MEVRLISLEVENFKKIKAARLRPTGSVTRIVGRNEAGKSSLLDALIVGIGGLKYAPSKPLRSGTEEGFITIDLDDIIVERRWKNGNDYLDVKTKDGAKYSSPQKMLDSFIGKIAFDPLAFQRMKSADQLATFANVAKVDIAGFKTRRDVLMEERKGLNRQIETVSAQLNGMPALNEEIPTEEMSVSGLLAKIDKADAHNKNLDAEWQKVSLAEQSLQSSKDDHQALALQLEAARKTVAKLEEQLSAKATEITEAGANVKTLTDRANTLARIDTDPIRAQMQQAEDVNKLVRQQKARRDKAAEGNALIAKSDELTAKLKALKDEQTAAVAAADLPITGLTLTDDGVELDGIPFEQCSAAQRLRTSTMIGLALNPKLRLMIIHDGSLLDNANMLLLAEIAEKADAQVLIERVDDDGHEKGMLVRIVDGETVEEGGAAPADAIEGAAKKVLTA